MMPLYEPRWVWWRQAAIIDVHRRGLQVNLSLLTFLLTNLRPSYLKSGTVNSHTQFIFRYPGLCLFYITFVLPSLDLLFAYYHYQYHYFPCLALLICPNYNEPHYFSSHLLLKIDDNYQNTHRVSSHLGT
eukprot:SAG11_NODE_5633_length_1501_cov_1.574893_2_plen_130_part_00